MKDQLKYQQHSRRQFLQNIATKWLVAFPFILNSCADSSTEKPANSNPCNDFSTIPEAEITKRKKLGYVDVSPIEESTCSNCNLYLVPKEDRPCGACMLFKGPVEAKGYCTYWAAKQEAS